MAELDYYWTCRDGARIPVKQMTTGHLRRAVAMLERAHAAKEILSILADFQVPDGVSEHVEDAINREVDAMASVGSDHPLYAWMVAELASRPSLAGATHA